MRFIRSLHRRLRPSRFGRLVTNGRFSLVSYIEYAPRCASGRAPRSASNRSVDVVVNNAVRALVPVLFAAACGDNIRAEVAVDAPPRIDARAIDAPDATSGPLNLTNLSPQTGLLVRADFVTPLAFSPDGTRVAAVANYATTVAIPTRNEPFVVNLDGTGVRRLVAISPACGNCDIELLAWTADSSTLFATGDLVINNDVEAFKLDPEVAQQTAVLAADDVIAGDVNNLFVVDAGVAGSRVWVVGDWLTDARRQAGAFSATATLPFSTATPPGLLVPAVPGPTELFDGAGSTADVFEARGAKIAAVVDSSVTGRFDLVVANADGSSPVTLVQGQPGIEISSVALSPDGTKVAFLMDSVAINNGNDLYVMATNGGAASAPIRVSPDRAGGFVNPDQGDVFFTVEWSRDSRFLAFSGDLTENNFDQGYLVDTMPSTPTVIELLARSEISSQASGAQGIRGKLLFDANNNVYFRARVTAGSTLFTFFKATPAGTKTVLALPPRADMSVPDIGSFGLTPDGTKLVFSCDSPDVDTFNLFLQPL